jgi:hypothetical protein
MSDHDYNHELGCDAEKLFAAIGRFVFEFSRLEDVLKGRLAFVLDLREEQWRSLMPGLDFAFACNAARKAFKDKYEESHPKTWSKLDRILSQALAMNQHRVRVAHGFWYLNGPHGLNVHFSRHTLMEGDFYFKEGQLLGLAAEIRSLRNDLWNAIKAASA